MRLRYHPGARDDLIRAVPYFDEQEMGLGNRFLHAIDTAIKEIAITPLMWPITKNGTRKRILVNPFPYTINYRVIHNEVVVVSIAHQSREPNYWKDRTE